MKPIKLLSIFYILSVIGLLFYSFTQVDLGLTLSKFPLYLQAEKYFQYIGFYQRPLSTLIFSTIAIVLFLCYFLFLYFAKRDKLNLKSLKLIVFSTFIILVFAYNAFSYDLFNYIFDAKILTFYHLNPYFYRPLDFPADPMLHFMRWVHRTYPYGPSWLALTAPLSLIGLNYFVVTFFLFKLLIGATYLGSSFLIYKISEKLMPKEKILNTVFFALNPLIIIEALVSSHNDFPLIFFGLFAIYLYVLKKKVLSFLSLLFSIGVKYVTIILLPAFIIIWYLDLKKKIIPWEKIILLSVLLSLVAVALASFRTTFQPWYLAFPLSLASFLSKKYYILIPSVVLSVFCLFIYIIYIYITDYAKAYPQIIFNIEALAILTAVIATFCYFLKMKFR